MAEIDRISLKRTVCYGTCPAYSVTLRRDGAAIWDGEAFVERMGWHNATVGLWDFEPLASFIERIGFFRWAPEFTREVTDNPTYTITVSRGDETKSVLQHATDEPPDFWVIAKLIDGIAEQLAWTAAGARTGGDRPNEDEGAQKTATGRVAPPWYAGSYGHDPAGWELARDQCRRTLVAWARRGRYGTYTDLTKEVTAIGWPEGAFAHQGRQIGMLLGHVSVAEWLEGRPLLSAMVVLANELIPGSGFFNLARELGELHGESPDEELAFWLRAFEACCDYPWPDR